MDWLEDKLEKWAVNIELRAGGDARRLVMRGSDRIRDLEPAAMAEWVRGAMERLAELVPEPATRCGILERFGCEFTEEFGEEPILAMRRLFEKTGDVDAVLAAMRADRSLGGASVYPPFVREAGEIRVTKRPCDPAGYENAKTPHDRQVAGCYCPLVKHALVEIPDFYCCCGAGWHAKIWEGITGGPVEVEVLETILRGGERCRFLVRLG
ncbi:MAG TPA: hypothetical protein VM054_11650 [bacterium]|nr:hypothetical protein [bacterium]